MQKILRRGGTSSRSEEELYKKDLHDPDNHDGVITDLEPDILECEVKWALESITTNKASGGHGIPVELFQILECCESAVLNMPANLENSAVATGIGKGQFSLQFQRKSVPKFVQTTTQLHSSHMLAKECSNPPSQASTVHEP